MATRAKTDALRAKTKSVAAQKEADRAQGVEKSMRIEAEHQLYAAKMNVAPRAAVPSPRSGARSWLMSSMRRWSP